jgi:hypothetical protein
LTSKYLNRIKQRKIITLNGVPCAVQYIIIKNTRCLHGRVKRKETHVVDLLGQFVLKSNIIGLEITTTGSKYSHRTSGLRCMVNPSSNIHMTLKGIVAPRSFIHSCYLWDDKLGMIDFFNLSRQPNEVGLNSLHFSISGKNADCNVYVKQICSLLVS